MARNGKRGLSALVSAVTSVPRNVIIMEPAGMALQLRCDKLIVATGLTSKPVMPRIDTSTFKGKIFHSKDFGKSHTFLTSDAVQSVIVVGGNKSPVEVARLCALAGKTVTWLIRPWSRHRA